MLKPADGHYTVTAVTRHLGVTAKRFQGLCKSLGIEVGPFIRDEPCVKKVYRYKKRWLSEEEAKRIITLYWARRR